MANPTTYFGWVMPNSADLVTDLPADFAVFGQGVDTSMQYLLGGTTGQVLSKTSGTNMAFTWVTPTDQTPLTTKGDLFAFTTVDARLAVGSNNQTLYADSTAATGLAWGASAKSTLTTTGDIVYASAANTLARLGIGSTGNVLSVSGGIPAWTTPASGLTLIKRATTSGAVNTGTTFDGVFTSTYKTYLIFIEKFTSATSTDDARFQFRTGGVTMSGAQYYGPATEITRTGTTTTISNVGTTYFTFGNDIGTTSGQGSTYELTINQVGNTSEKAKGFFQGQSELNQAAINGAFLANQDQVYDGILFSSSGNIAITVSVYGLATS